MICDSQTSNAIKLYIYKAKEPSYQRASSLGSTVVINLSDSYKNSFRNITCDNFFTRLHLGREELRKKLTIVEKKQGKNRTDLPTDFTVAEVNSVTCVSFKEIQHLFPIGQGKTKLSHCYVQCTMK